MEKDPFKEYLRESEPDKAYKGYAWSTAIGLQEVDGLKPSKYLIDTAIQNIEGKITMKEANMIFHRRKILVIKDFQWTRLSIILRYLFQGYGKSISSGKAIREQRQCSSLNI